MPGESNTHAHTPEWLVGACLIEGQNMPGIGHFCPFNVFVLFCSQIPSPSGGGWPRLKILPGIHPQPSQTGNSIRTGEEVSPRGYLPHGEGCLEHHFLKVQFHPKNKLFGASRKKKQRILNKKKWSPTSGTWKGSEHSPTCPSPPAGRGSSLLVQNWGIKTVK